jgi:hypothetical protein
VEPLNPDELVALVKSAKEIAQLPAVQATADSALAIVREFFGAMQDKVRIWRMENLTGSLMKYAEACKRAGVPPELAEQVAHKFAVPWIEAASLEDDPTLQELYGNLLRNAASDPTTRPGFIATLKLLQRRDLELLQLYYAAHVLKLPYGPRLNSSDVVSAHQLVSLGCVERAFETIDSDALQRRGGGLVKGWGDLVRRTFNNMELMVAPKRGSFKVTPYGVALMNACIDDVDAFLDRQTAGNAELQQYLKMRRDFEAAQRTAGSGS